MPKDIQTTQKTSKKWKLLQILGWISAVPTFMLALITFAIAAAASEQGEHAMWVVAVPCMLLFLASVGLIVYARWMAWWHHG